MYTRVLIYDLKNGDQKDYQDLYDLLDDYKAQGLSESAYYIQTEEPLVDFKKKIKAVTKDGDNVKLVIKTDGDLGITTIR